MEKTKRKSPTEMPLPFQLEPEPAEDTLTSFGGVPLLVQAYRSLGGPGQVRKHVQVKQRQLYEFHDEEKMAVAEAQREAGQAAVVAEEGEALKGLGAVNRAIIAEIGDRCRNQRIATVDMDATIIESQKREAMKTYEGESGYQPMLGVWAETDLILADEFRDGNVVAMYKPLEFAKKAFAALPETVTEYYFRGDSACDERHRMQWLSDVDREKGPTGFIGFAISARIHPQLRQALEDLPESEWKPAASDDPHEIRHYSEVPFEPWQPYDGKKEPSLRYVGIRVRRKQNELFGDDEKVKHFAIVTNTSWPAAKLVSWHREKAGSIEPIHDVIKNELGAGVLPCGRFGANAAWFRLAVITHNVMTALKRIALPAKYLTARPKRMRFLFFHTAGRVVHHARAVWLRIASLAETLSEMHQAFHALPIRL